MKIGVILVCAALTACANAQNFVGWSFERGRDRPLSTRPVYPYERADSTARPGFRGPVFISDGHIGGRPNFPVAWGSPGPDYYGAGQFDDPTFYYRQGNLTLGSTPWIDVPVNGFERYERARNLWLREHGYVGGVRVHVNPARVSGAMYETAQIKPRATIRIPDDVPRYRPNMEVNRVAPAPAIASVPGEGPMRISLPPIAGAELRERVAVANSEFAADGTKVASTR